MLFDGIEHGEETIKVEIAVEMRSRVPFCVEIDKQKITRSHHLIIVEYEDRLHLDAGSLGFSAQGLVILVNREIERRIEGLVLPRFGKLVLVLELARTRHKPADQCNGHQEDEHLAYAIVIVSYFIKEIFYFAHNQTFNDQLNRLNRVLN